MNRLLRIGALSCLLALAACSSAGPVRYDVTLVGVPEEEMATVLVGIDHVIRSRLGRLNVIPEDLQVAPAGSGAVVTMTISAEAARQLTSELIAPYSLRIARAVGSGATTGNPTFEVAQRGLFEETGITEGDIAWAVAGKDDAGNGSVTLEFTDPGNAKLAALAKQFAGQEMGLFAKGKLISVFVITQDFGSDLTLDKIPSEGLARVFADDVNVGLHARFAPAESAASSSAD